MPSLDALVAASWQGALLALVAWAFCRLAPKAPASARAALWWAVSLKMALAVLAPSALALPLLAPPAPAVAAPVAAPAAAVAVTTVAPSQRADEPSPEGLLRLVWIAGAAVLLLAHLRQGQRLQSVLRRSRPLGSGDTAEAARSLSAALGLRRVPELRLSDEIDTPLVARAWRPVVLLPVRFVEESTADEVAMALAHELAHVRSRDLLFAFVPALAGLLLWFHPAAWLAAREWTAEREADCDAVALLVTGGSPAAYGELLVRVAEAGRRPAFAAPASLGAASAYPTLRKRVESMKNRPTPPSRALRAAGLAVASIALLAALPWSVTAQTAPKSAAKTFRIAGTWTATRPVLEMKMQYTFKADGSYLAALGEMDHQGQYRVEGRRVVLTPDVVAQRKASVFLQEQSKNPDDLSSSELVYIKRLAKPYAMTLGSDGKSLAGLGFVAKLDPKAKPLF